MKTIKFFSLLAIFTAIFSLTSCNSSDGPEGEYQAGVFANYEGANGMDLNFKYTAPNTDESINIIARATSLSEGMSIAAGTRVYLIVNVKYGQEVVNNSVVSFYGLAKLNTYESVEVTTVPENWANSKEIYITTISRAGKYLDIMAMAPQAEGATLRLIADEATVNTENPVLYLMYNAGESNSASVNYVASFDIAEVINKPTCKKITVRMQNSNGETAPSFVIRK